MGLQAVLTSVVVVVSVLLAVSLPVVVGVGRLRAAPTLGIQRLRESRREVAFLGVVLGVNRLVRDVGVELSWLVGVNVTALIHGLEGGVVAQIQAYGTPAATAYFGFAYVYGYTFLLVFPFVAYLVLDRARPLRVLAVAYGLNYLIGLACYVLFVAYGPRNFMPGLVEPLLYVHWPDVQLLTSRVNSNTNVFPSLHASLSATVAHLAVRYRDAYPRWTPIAVAFAVSIAVATMYLGIHWFTDVAFGLGLAVLSIRLADRWVGDPDGHGGGIAWDETRGLSQVFGDD